MLTILTLINFISRAPISVITALIMCLTLRISLGILIMQQSKTRELDGGRLWAAFTIVFSAILGVLYLLINKNIGTTSDNPNYKKHQRYLIIICLLAVAVIAACYPVFKYESNKSALKEAYDCSVHVPFLNEDNTGYDYYDKMGVKYDELNEISIPYYSENGVKYHCEDDNDSMVDDAAYLDTDYSDYNFVSEDRSIIINQKNALINDKGYLVEADISKLKETKISSNGYTSYVYTDNNGNLFFKPDDCSWDKDGNLVFKSEELSEYYKNAKNK